MNKQELAQKIWDTAQNMRGSIDASQYKNYIFGFLFYKFLSEKEIELLKKEGATDEELQEVNENNPQIVEHIQNSIGYFISYDNLFSTWYKKGSDFTIADVRTGLSAFDRLIQRNEPGEDGKIIPSNAEKVFKGIFDTMQSSLSDLGSTDAEQTKVVRKLVSTINTIPMNEKNDFDVLGYVYEYLLKNFAANAGKKAGEFFSPTEVCRVISEVVAYHLRDQETISIYDPTSGSGSLLLTIGKAVSKHMINPNGIKYYAQELLKDSYNLTRMNLIMNNILPSNIFARNGDTLAQDWPFFEEGDPENTYIPLYLDAAVSNPPYSSHFDNSICDGDPRFVYGTAPESKADYAFLLHNLYHLNDHGIMGIILPHGVLFRGGEEAAIRKNLLENHHIDTIVGLADHLFYGTGIPTVIIFLKKQRNDDSVLFIDASKNFVKDGKQNRLRECDIRKIVDTVIQRREEKHFSRVVSLDEIRQNDYNLNIPRYIDNGDTGEHWDLHSLFYGGLPQEEIDALQPYWDVFNGLENELIQIGNPNTFKVESLKTFIDTYPSVQEFKKKYQDAFKGFDGLLDQWLVKEKSTASIHTVQEQITQELFQRLKTLPLVDVYQAYQIFADAWKDIETDLEIIQSEGETAITRVIPRMVITKKNKEYVEKQDGFMGQILPFDLVQKELLSTQLEALQSLENRKNEIQSELETLIEGISEEDKGDFIREDGSAFDKKELDATIKTIQSHITNDEIKVLQQYDKMILNKAKKEELLKFVQEHKKPDWSQISAKKDGTHTHKEIQKRIDAIRNEYVFEEDTLEATLLEARNLLEENKGLDKTIKEAQKALVEKTIETIENLSDEEADTLLHQKWITSMEKALLSIGNDVVFHFITQLEDLQKKYEIKLPDLDKKIQKTEQELLGLIGKLTGSEKDMEAVDAMKAMLGGFYG